MADFSEGPNAVGSATNDTSSGTEAWINPNDVTGSGTGYTYSFVDKAITNYLNCQGFGFSIPSGMVILGIEVEVTRSFQEGSLATSGVSLIKDGTLHGDAKTSGTWTSETLGTPTDLWGGTWTADEINEDFGLVIQADGGANGVTVRVSAVEVTVYYTDEGAEPDPSSQSIMFHPY